MSSGRSGHRPATPGMVYGAPGAGYSGHISLITSLALIALWFLVTGAGWVRPLFLPSPFAVYDKFVFAMTEGVANSTLTEHALASLSRVFGAFFLACLTAIPVGILMGVNRSAHILTPASTVRRIVNMTAVAAVDAQIRAAQGSRRG